MEKKEYSVATSTLFKVVLIGIALLFLWNIRDIILLLLISVTLASGLEPLVEFFNKRKVPRAVSILSVYLLTILFIAFILAIVSPTVISQLGELGANKETLVADFNRQLGSNDFFVQFNVPEMVSKGVQSFGEELTKFSDNFFETTVGLFNGFVKVLTILVISFYLVAERNGMKNFIVPFVPAHLEPKVVRIVNKIQRKVGLWIISQFIISLVVFGLVLLGLTVLGVKYALVLALLAGFFELIPYIGPIIFSIPGIFFAFLQDPVLAIVVAFMYILIQKTEAYVLIPKIMEKSIGVSPLVILVAILVGLKLAGIVGVLLAIPVVAGLNVVVEEWWGERNSRFHRDGIPERAE